VTLTVYHYPNCSTCKKAIAWLRAHAVDHSLVDIVKQPPARAVLERATMTDAQAYAALAADGKLIKRPLAVGDGVALVGFDESAWSQALARGAK
jgi:arsenate reductase (glutaredoxin)